MSSDKSDKAGKNDTSELESATANMNLISASDCDVNHKEGPQEYTFLSDAYTRTYQQGTRILKSTHWCFVTFNLTKLDSKNTYTFPMPDKKGNTTRVRLVKPKFPSFLKGGNALNTFCDTAFRDNPEAAAGFSEGAINQQERADLKDVTLIDVHFPARIQETVERIADKHIEFFKKKSVKCYNCELREMLECPNVVAFEVTAARASTVAAATQRQENDEAELSE
jgi:hypothetical protein